MFEELGVKQIRPIKVYEDNTATIAMSNNPIINKKSKHIELSYHFFKYYIQNKTIQLYYIVSINQLADIMTKVVSSMDLFYSLVKKIFNLTTISNGKSKQDTYVGQVNVTMFKIDSSKSEGLEYNTKEGTTARIERIKRVWNHIRSSGSQYLRSEQFDIEYKNKVVQREIFLHEWETNVYFYIEELKMLADIFVDYLKETSNTYPSYFPGLTKDLCIVRNNGLRRDSLAHLKKYNKHIEKILEHIQTIRRVIVWFDINKNKLSGTRDGDNTNRETSLLIVKNDKQSIIDKELSPNEIYQRTIVKTVYRINNSPKFTNPIIDFDINNVQQRERIEQNFNDQLCSENPVPYFDPNNHEERDTVKRAYLVKIHNLIYSDPTLQDQSEEINDAEADYFELHYKYSGDLGDKYAKRKSQIVEMFGSCSMLSNIVDTDQEEKRLWLENDSIFQQEQRRIENLSIDTNDKHSLIKIKEDQSLNRRDVFNANKLKETENFLANDRAHQEDIIRISKYNSLSKQEQQILIDKSSNFAINHRLNDYINRNNNVITADLYNTVFPNVVSTSSNNNNNTTAYMEHFNAAQQVPANQITTLTHHLKKTNHQPLLSEKDKLPIESPKHRQHHKRMSTDDLREFYHLVHIQYPVIFQEIINTIALTRNLFDDQSKESNKSVHFKSSKQLKYAKESDEDNEDDDDDDDDSNNNDKHPTYLAIQNKLNIQQEKQETKHKKRKTKETVSKRPSLRSDDKHDDQTSVTDNNKNENNNDNNDDNDNNSNET
jgi:hypothetical protein